MDSVPGASCQITIPGTAEPQEALLFGSSLWGQPKPEGTEITISGMSSPGLVHEEGLLLTGSDGNMVNVKRVKMGGKMRQAATICQVTKQVKLILNAEEKEIVENIREIWEGILSVDVDDDTDFFACGAGSMDVVRLV